MGPSVREATSRGTPSREDLHAVDRPFSRPEEYHDPPLDPHYLTGKRGQSAEGLGVDLSRCLDLDSPQFAAYFSPRGGAFLT